MAVTDRRQKQFAGQLPGERLILEVGRGTVYVKSQDAPEGVPVMLAPDTARAVAASLLEFADAAERR